MRSVVPEDAKVGLLLFDEPSASLDPVAEHGEWITLGLTWPRREFLSHCTDATMVAQTSSTAFANSVGARRCSSLRIALETSRATPI